MPARRTRAVEAVEDVRKILVRDARAVVADDELPSRTARPPPPRPPGSTSPRCRGGCPTARSMRGRDALYRRRLELEPSTATSGRFLRARSTASATSRSRRTSSGSTDELLGPRELDELGDERRHLAELLDDVARAAARARRAGACCRPASTSMFVRTLVSGVRSSCDASATSWRCARVDSSRAASIVLKLAASRLSSSLPVDLDPLREVLGLGHSLDRASSAAAPARAPHARRARPSAAAMTIPASAMRIRKRPMRCERLVRPRSAGARPEPPRPARTRR